MATERPERPDAMLVNNRDISGGIARLARGQSVCTKSRRPGSLDPNKAHLRHQGAPQETLLIVAQQKGVLENSPLIATVPTNLEAELGTLEKYRRQGGVAIDLPLITVLGSMLWVTEKTKNTKGKVLRCMRNMSMLMF